MDVPGKTDCAVNLPSSKIPQIFLFKLFRSALPSDLLKKEMRIILALKIAIDFILVTFFYGFLYGKERLWISHGFLSALSWKRRKQEAPFSSFHEILFFRYPFLRFLYCNKDLRPFLKFFRLIFHCCTVSISKYPRRARF